eukprot:TRINITY_DN1309_c0_g1_i1.p3 TRINITY_DN1309_c0_g1~~TRINITY_DN1309_c0_g1_i1.p3  ORF type:complete len:111 (-),score=13.71 TRINITY_DN1309_c0_g1_i1:1645-1977(-)
MQQTQQQMLQQLGALGVIEGRLNLVEVEMRRNYSRMLNSKAALSDYSPLHPLPAANGGPPAGFPDRMPTLRRLTHNACDQLLTAYAQPIIQNELLDDKVQRLALFIGAAS